MLRVHFADLSVLAEGLCHDPTRCSSSPKNGTR